MKESNFVVKTSAVTILVVVTLLFAAFVGGFALGRSEGGNAIRVAALPAAQATSASASTAPAASVAVSFPLDINTATLEQLQQIPHIGAVLAQRIVDHRAQYGLFRSVSELLEIDGIGEKTLETLLPYITVN